jgi:hypothetical protein
MNMRTLPGTCCRTDRLALPRLAGSVLLVLLFMAWEGRAQYRIDQDGRLFDANPQIGGNGYNSYIRPVSPLVGGNLFASGNVTRGLSLRSFSPIGAPGEFRAPLGSASLSNFIRDSVSVADQVAPLGGLAPQAFFDPARTVPTGSYLRGFYDFQPTYPTQPLTLPGTAALTPTTPFDGLSRYGSPPTWRAELERVTRAPYESTGTPLNTQLSSTIFGLQAPALPGLLPDTALQPLSAYPLGVESGEPGSEEVSVSVGGAQEPLDLRVWPSLPVPSTPTPLDVAMQEEATRLLTERPLPTLLQPGEVPGGPGTELRPEEAVSAGVPPGEPAQVGATGVLGGDVFTDLQLALDLWLNPQADWYTKTLGAVPESSTEPTLSMEMQARAVAAAEEFLTRMLDTPLQTFVGESASAVNKELRKAEAAMELGRYYDAVRCYERVRRLDPANPLPLIGKGHALLAAGEYISAALSLIRGLERFPELTRFQIDLTALMGGGEIVDIRRADLMEHLARNEDPQLRFLLGYLEVHTGQRELGLQNLDQAAREAKPGSLIRRYPDMIRRERIGPRLGLLPGESPDTTKNESQSPDSDRSLRGKESE